MGGKIEGMQKSRRHQQQRQDVQTDERDRHQRIQKGTSHNINVGAFKSNFEQVSRCRYEEDPRRLEEILEEVEDISNTDRAREANDLINEEPQEEEIEDTMKEVKDSAPGEDNIRMSYI